MRHTKLKLGAILLLGLGLTGLQAQESINTSGGSASGNGGSVSNSIGQVFYTASNGTGGSATQGVQQPYVISVETGIEESKGINLRITAYPNPASDYLTLSVDDFDLTNLAYQLYDMQGKLLQNGRITETRTKIVLNNLAPSSYFVRVFQGNNEVKTFKVIKH